MLNPKKIFFILILISTISYAEIKTIQFAVSIPGAPFTEQHVNQELQGFDIDIAKALCDKIKARCVFTADKIGNMITSLKTGKYDAWIGSVTVTPEREKEIAFSANYFSSVAKLIATNATTFSAAPIEIKGKTIGGEVDTDFVLYLQNTYGNTIKIQIFPSIATAYAALENGKIDAFIGDAIVLQHWRDQHSNRKKYRLIGLPYKHLRLIQQKYSIAIAKDNSALVIAINQALTEIKSDGTYNKIIKKHF